MAEAPKRRLPVLQGGGGGSGEGEEERPPWHWAVFGAVATFAAWLPLAAGTNALLRRMLVDVAGAAPPPRTQAVMVGLNALAFALAALAGGFLVGRFGARAGAGRREATASGAIAGGIAWGLALGQGAPAGVLGWAMLLVVMATLGGGAARLGGWLGLRGRR